MSTSGSLVLEKDFVLRQAGKIKEKRMRSIADLLLFGVRRKSSKLKQ